MKKREIILEYSGFPTFSTIGRLLTLLKYKKAEKNINACIHKRMLSVMIEALENVYKYSDEVFDNQFITKNFLPYFTITKNSEAFFISVSNPVKNEDAIKLKSKIDNVNKQKPDELKLLYRKTISNGKFNKKGGAGLGIIEMAKISGNKLNYSFEPINDEYQLYTLNILFH